MTLNITDSYIINKLQHANNQHSTSTAAAGSTTITVGSSASDDIGMGGINLQDEQFSINDGSTTITYTYLQACHESNANCPSATQLKTGSGRTAAQAVSEIATKVNASALNITANASQNVVTLTPAGGVTITVTELNDGQLGGNANDWVAASSAGSVNVSIPTTVPFSLSVPRAQIIRKQSNTQSHRTTLK